MSWLLPEVDALERAIAGLRLSLAFGSGDELVARLRSGAIDAVVSSARLHDRTLEMLPLHAERYAFVVAPARLKKAPFAKADHAAEYTLLDIDPSLPLYRYFADAESAPHCVFAEQRYFGTIEALRTRVLRGAGVAVLPEYLVQKDLATCKLARLFPRVNLLADAFRLVHRKGDPHGDVLAQVASQLREIALR